MKFHYSIAPRIALQYARKVLGFRALITPQAVVDGADIFIEGEVDYIPLERSDIPSKLRDPSIATRPRCWRRKISRPHSVRGISKEINFYPERVLGNWTRKKKKMKDKSTSTTGYVASARAIPVDYQIIGNRCADHVALFLPARLVARDADARGSSVWINGPRALVWSAALTWLFNYDCRSMETIKLLIDGTRPVGAREFGAPSFRRLTSAPRKAAPDRRRHGGIRK